MRYFRLIASMTVVAAAGCSGSTGPDSGLALTAALDQTAFVSGDTLQITVSVKNNRATELTIAKSLGCGGAGPGLRVTNSAGGDVVNAPIHLPGTCEASFIAKVPPGGTYSTVIDWNGESIDGSITGNRVPAGRYDVRGVFVSDDKVIAESPPVSVQVLALQ